MASILLPEEQQLSPLYLEFTVHCIQKILLCCVHYPTKQSVKAPDMHPCIFTCSEAYGCQQQSQKQYSIVKRSLSIRIVLPKCINCMFKGKGVFGVVLASLPLIMPCQSTDHSFNIIYIFQLCKKACRGALFTCCSQGSEIPWKLEDQITILGKIKKKIKLPLFLMYSDLLKSHCSLVRLEIVIPVLKIIVKFSFKNL